MLNADRYLPVDGTLIPLENSKQSDGGTPMDFTSPQRIGSRIAQVPGGYDHCYVLNKGKAGELAGRWAADAKSGRTMELYTTEPACNSTRRTGCTSEKRHDL